MNEPAFHRDPYLRALETEVLSAGTDGDQPFALLADTLFYPEGGGQPADHGWIAPLATGTSGQEATGTENANANGSGEGTPDDVGGDGAQVRDVQKGDDGIRHYLSRPLPPGPVALRLDWRRRFDHMQQHTAQHLVSALAADRFGWKTTAFHLSEELCDIELDVPALDTDQLAQLEEAVAAEVRAARPITTRRVAPEALAGLNVRTRGLPAGHTGDVRLVEIAGLDLNTCGGTHVATTAEIEAVKLLHSETMRGGSRLYWVAGGRLRRRLGERESLLEELRRTVGAADAELPAVVALKLDQLKAEQRRARHLEGQLADSLVASLASAAATAEGRAIHRHFDDTSPGVLQQLGRAFTAQAGPGVALLTATSDGTHFFLLATGEDSSVDLRAAGNRIAELLEGRGGGARHLFQGKAGSLARADEALAALRSSSK